MVVRDPAYAHYPENKDYNKLVRDKVPARLERMGLVVKWHRVKSVFHYRELLNEKLREETQEVIDAPDQENLTTELCDVLSVLMAMAEAAEIEWEDVVNTERAKFYSHGDFSGRTFLTGTRSAD